MSCSVVRFGRVGLALCLALAVAACSSIESMEPARDYSSKIGSQIDNYPVRGIDVSRYQGTIDWPAAARSGVRFAYIKATEGGDRADDRFDVNWRQARAAGIPTGAYHFYYFCRPVEEQIAWFKTHVPPARDALPPVLDMEWNHNSPTCKLRPPPDKVKADMATFLAEMESFYGKRPIVYTTVDFHRDVLADGSLNAHGFWLRSVASHPAQKYGDRPWTFWQYTATGRVPGVSGKVDRNVFAGTEEQWQRFLSDNKVGMAVASADPPASSSAAPSFASMSGPPTAPLSPPAAEASTAIPAAQPVALVPPPPEDPVSLAEMY
jgi:lysozyme